MTTAMILAAGRGERLRPFTDAVPKALVEVRGERLIDRHLRMLGAAGVENVLVNLGWLGEKIVEHIGSGSRFGVNVVYSPEYDNVLETGGGICRALPMLGANPFWVVNGDIYTDFALPDDKLPDDADARLVLVPTPAHKARGDFDLVDGLVRRGESPSLTYSGIAQYRPAFFHGAGTGRFSVAPMLMEAADNGKLAGSLYSGTWEDVGTPQRLAYLNRT
jgi:MurNAc alpha-1-phosphate uridylyltransferase